MTLVRWSAAPTFETMRRQMDRLFDVFDDDSARSLFAGASTWTPRVDIVEKDDEIILTAELAGLGRDDVDLHIENDVLTLSGERKSEHSESQDGYTRLERQYGSFRREFRLPDSVDVSKVTANMSNGVLRIAFPKREEAKPRQIAVDIN